MLPHRRLDLTTPFTVGRSVDLNTWIFIIQHYETLQNYPFVDFYFYIEHLSSLLSTPMGVDYVVIGFDMEVQPLVTHNAAWPFCVSAVWIDVVSNHLLFAYAMSAVGIDVVSSHTKYCRIAYGITREQNALQCTNEWTVSVFMSF